MSRIEPFLQASTAGFLHIPSEPLDQALVLTHGAGGNCQAPLLVVVANAFADAGFHVLRCDLAFRKRKRAGPPHPSQSAEDRNGLLADLNVMRGFVSGRILLGGHSYGGRQASILASENSSVCDALLLLSYPLHPPDKPNQLRTAHFAGLKTPSLFVHGSKGPIRNSGGVPHCPETYLRSRRTLHSRKRRTRPQPRPLRYRLPSSSSPCES